MYAFLEYITYTECGAAAAVRARKHQYRRQHPAQHTVAALSARAGHRRPYDSGVRYRAVEAALARGAGTIGQRGLPPLASSASLQQQHHLGACTWILRIVVRAGEQVSGQTDDGKIYWRTGMRWWWR